MHFEQLERRQLLSGTIEGHLFVDINGDGTLDPGDQIRPGITIYLDANENGQRDTGETSVLSDAQGKYRFDNVPAGEHLIALDDADVTVNDPDQNALRLLSTWDGAPEAPAAPDGGGVTTLHPDDGHDHGGGPGTKYADVWTDGDLAVVGRFQSDSSVDILDLSDPTNPVLLSTWTAPTPNLRFQDVKLLDGIGYFASEGGGGMSIVDLTDPTNPVLLKQITTADGGFNQIHNVFIADGYLYQVDSRTRIVRVFDVSDPANAFHVRNITTTDPRFIHDITVVNGRLYTSGFGNSSVGGTTDIYDVSDIADANWSTATHLLGTVHSGVNNHSNWVSDDGNLLAIAREINGGDVELWDISDPANPALLSTISGASLGIATVSPHNPVIRDQFLYISWYQNGLVVIDISDPTQPQLAGQYDTFDGSDSGFNGNWGVHLTGRDQIVASDTVSGLFVFELAAPFANIVTLEDGQAETGKDFILADTTPPSVMEVMIAEGLDQRSMISHVEFAFSEDVDASLTEASLMIQDMDTFNMIDPSNFELHLDATSHHASWHFHGLANNTLPDGNYRVWLDESTITDAQGNSLESMPPVDLHRYYGDADGDRDLDAADLFTFRSAFQTGTPNPDYVPYLDVDNDGDIDAVELFAFRQRYLTSLPMPMPSAQASTSESPDASLLASFARQSPSTAPLKATTSPSFSGVNSDDSDDLSITFLDEEPDLLLFD